MKTKIILLSIFLLFTIQALASSVCTTQRTEDKQHNQTSFVFVVDPNIVERDKLLYILEQVSCGIPKNHNFNSSLLNGNHLPVHENNIDVFRQFLSSVNNPGDYCSTLANDLDQLTKDQQNIHLIVTMSKQDQCSLTETYRQFKSSKPNLHNFHMNVILLDDSQVMGYNFVRIPTDFINLTEVVPPLELSNKIGKFVSRMLQHLEPNNKPTRTPKPPDNHPHHHHQDDEELEPWMIIAIIIIVVMMLIGVIIGSLCLRNRMKQKSERHSRESGSGTLPAENEAPSKEKLVKKVSKEPLRPNNIPTSTSTISGATEPIKLKKKQSTKTKSTLSYSITLESVKSKKNKSGSKQSASKESVSKEGVSKETVSNASAENAEKTKMKTAEEPSKKNKEGAVIVL